MKICFLSQLFYPVTGGIERYVFNLSTGLAKLKQEVYVITLRHKNRPKYEELEGVHIYRVARGEDPYFVLGLYSMKKKAEEVYKKETFDIIHGQIPHLPTCLLQKKKIGAKFIETIHVPIEVEVRASRAGFTDLLFWEKFMIVSHPFTKFLEKYMIKRADGLIVVSNCTKQDAMRCYGIPGERVKVIYEGIEIRRFRNLKRKALREKLGLEEEPTILYVGRHCARKRIDWLLYAFAIVKRTCKDAILILAGKETKYTQRLKKLSHALGINEHVIFTGYVPEKDLPHLFASGDIFAISSQQEAFGFTVAEAMAAGLPVVVPNVAALPELVVHGKTGFLFNSFQELVEYLTLLLMDRKLSKHMGEEGRKRILENFTCEKMVKETLKFYEELLA